MARTNSKPSGAKLARWLTFNRRPISISGCCWRLTRPVSVCECLGLVQFNGQQYLADLWLRYADYQESVILYDSARAFHSSLNSNMA